MFPKIIHPGSFKAQYYTKVKPVWKHWCFEQNVFFMCHNSLLVQLKLLPNDKMTLVNQMQSHYFNCAYNKNRMQQITLFDLSSKIITVEFKA